MWEERTHLDLNQASLEKLWPNYLKFEGGNTARYGCNHTILAEGQSCN